MAALVTFSAIFIIFLTLSTTINARESQFFAKISNNIPKETQPLNTNQQDPNFIPETQPDGGAYGLYGHGSGQLPPSATDTSLPANLPENYNPVAYTTPIHSTQEFPEEFNDVKAYQLTGENGGDMYNSEKQETAVKFANGGDMYNYQKQGMSDTRFMENGRYYYAGGDGYKSEKPQLEDTRFMETEDGGNMYNSQQQESEEMYNSEKQGLDLGETKYGTSNNANVYNMEKQGMSDTRFLENGKYYYDLNLENSNSRNGYNTNGYNGNNFVNSRAYDRYNSNGGYQNQEDFQDNQFNP